MASCYRARSQPDPLVDPIGLAYLDLDPENPETKAAIKEFVAELARRDYVESKNVVFERRAGRPENTVNARALASELVRAKVDVIYVIGGTFGALVARDATSTLPIVFHNSADPVALGLVNSLARPGGNLTGVASQYFDQMAKGLEYLAKATRNLKSFAYITNAKNRSLPGFQGQVSKLPVARARRWESACSL